MVDLEEAKAARASRRPERRGLDRFLDWPEVGLYVIKARAFVPFEKITREQVARWFEACDSAKLLLPHGLGSLPVRVSDFPAVVLARADRLELAVYAAELQHDTFERRIKEGKDKDLDYEKGALWNGFIYVTDALCEKSPAAALTVGNRIGDDEKRSEIVSMVVQHELTTGDLKSGLLYARVLNKDERDAVLSRSLAYLVSHE